MRAACCCMTNRFAGRKDALLVQYPSASAGSDHGEPHGLRRTQPKARVSMLSETFS